MPSTASTVTNLRACATGPCVLPAGGSPDSSPGSTLREEHPLRAHGGKGGIRAGTGSLVRQAEGSWSTRPHGDARSTSGGHSSVCVSHSNRRGGSESGLTSNILSSLSSGAKAACCQAVMRIRNDYLVTGDPKPSTEKYQYFLCHSLRAGIRTWPTQASLLCAAWGLGFCPAASWPIRIPALTGAIPWPGARMHGALEPLPMASPNAPHVHTT